MMETLMIALAAADDSLWTRTLEFMSAEYRFAMWSALGSVLVGLCGGLLGSFLVLRRMSLMGDVLSHAMLPGIVAGFLIVQAKLLLPLYSGALISGVAAAMVFGAIVRQGRTRPDAALGLVLTTFFGLGIVLLSYARASPSGQQAGLDQFLFGDASAIFPSEVGVLGVIAAVAIAVTITAYKPLVLLSFDPGFARSIGYNTALTHYGLMALTSLAIVASIQSVGVVLVVAMLITPASTAYLLSRRLPVMLTLAAIFGMISGYVGALLSYLFDDLSSGPTMVLVASGLFLLAALFNPRQGLVKTLWSRLRRARVQREALLIELIKRVAEDGASAPSSALEAIYGDRARQLQRALKRLEAAGVLSIDPESGEVTLDPSSAADLHGYPSDVHMVRS